MPNVQVSRKVLQCELIQEIYLFEVVTHQDKEDQKLSLRVFGERSTEGSTPPTNTPAAV